MSNEAARAVAEMGHAELVEEVLRLRAYVASPWRETPGQVLNGEVAVSRCDTSVVMMGDVPHEVGVDVILHLMGAPPAVAALLGRLGVSLRDATTWTATVVEN